MSPKVWRRVQIKSDYNFWDLHIAIQDAMGWLDYHLHHFVIKGKGKRKKVHIGIPDFNEYDEEQEIYPGWEVPIINHFNNLGVKAEYIYDYGWSHTVVLEGYIIKDKKTEYPICIGGERACPPEDCGGPGGYEDLLKTLNNPEDEEHETVKAWLPSNWSPEEFEFQKVDFDPPYFRWYNVLLKNKYPFSF